MPSFLRKLVDFKKEEIPVAALLFSFFFLVMAAFQSLKSQKKALFVETYGADLELYAKLVNILMAVLAMAAFAWLYNRLERQRLIYAFCIFLAANFWWLALALERPSKAEIWWFYLVGDLVTTLMVAAFFAYLTDISDADQAKRLYGVIGGGGVLGGLAGAALTRALLGQAGLRGLLTLAGAALAAVAAVTYAAERLVARGGAFRTQSPLRVVRQEAAPKRSAWTEAVEGLQLVLGSRYLAAIVGIMASYEIASQSIDYQFSHMSEALSGLAETQHFMATAYLLMNAMSVTVQFLLVSLIMRKLGLVVALTILPVVVAAGSIGFLAAPGLLLAGFLFVSDGGLNYSLQQTARESLYVVTTPEEKYKARAFTNMFVQRLAKGAAIFALLGIGARYLSVITVAASVFMIVCGVYAGRRFERKSAALEPLPKAA